MNLRTIFTSIKETKKGRLLTIKKKSKKKPKKENKTNIIHYYEWCIWIVIEISTPRLWNRARTRNIFSFMLDLLICCS